MATVLTAPSIAPIAHATDVLEPVDCPRTYVAGFFKLADKPTVGEISVHFRVDTDGTLQNARANPSKLGKRIEKAAIRAVSKWRYAAGNAGDAEVTLILSNQWRRRPDSCIHLTVHDFSSMSEAEMRAFNELNTKEN